MCLSSFTSADVTPSKFQRQPAYRNESAANGQILVKQAKFEWSWRGHAALTAEILLAAARCQFEVLLRSYTGVGSTYQTRDSGGVT